MTDIPSCPKCHKENTYPDGELFICPDCAHEWSQQAAVPAAADDEDKLVVKDAYGNLLQDGDSVTLIKDLKVKGSSLTLKTGTKIKNIRLVAGDHDLDCRVDGMSLMLKSCFMKKA
ncbi:MAG: zinc ribbon domain-containing protein YjdM [Pseudomonadota bacterium]